VISDTFDTLDPVFWNPDISHSAIVADPITGTGSVLRIQDSAGGAGHINHVFDETMYGTLSLDVYSPIYSPNQALTFRTDSDYVGALAISGSQISPLYGIFSEDTNVGGVLDMSGWHNYAMVIDGTNASSYIDGVLYGTMSNTGGINNVSFSCTNAGYVYVDNFNFTPAEVPEPSSFFLFGSGLLGMIGYMVRKIRVS
jgi:hypothetical protein